MGKLMPFVISMSWRKEREREREREEESVKAKKRETEIETDTISDRQTDRNGERARQR